MLKFREKVFPLPAEVDGLGGILDQLLKHSVAQRFGDSKEAGGNGLPKLGGLPKPGTAQGKGAGMDDFNMIAGLKHAFVVRTLFIQSGPCHD